MAQSDDRGENTLPVTAEVGSEGGSFADPTMQVATFADGKGIAHDEGQGIASSFVEGKATYRDTVGSGLSDNPDPGAGMVRYPTEPPAPPSATEGRRAVAGPWRAGLIGAAAGAGAAVAVALLNRRR